MIDFTTDFGRAVERYLNEKYVIWLTTVDSRLLPQPRPVWFLWKNGAILIFSKPDAHKVKHIQKHPRVSLHFNTDETGDRGVIILTGEATIATDRPSPADVSAYLQKYRTGITDLGMTPQSFWAEYSTPIQIHPSKVRGWE